MSGHAGDEDGANLISELQAAREYALLGNYEAALIYFDGVLKAVNDTLRHTPTSDERQTWLRVRASVAAELRLPFHTRRVGHCR